ncbi:MAG: glycosyltransferase family A protein [Ornithinimicrobium sp.]
MAEPVSGQRPSVCAVIPVHQGARTITRAIRSIQHQTVPVDQIIVVDDHSTDGTPERVAAIDDERLMLLHSTRRGSGHARNLAIAATEADLIAFLDADDVFYPDKIETQLPLIGEGIAYVGALVHYLGEDGRILGSHLRYTDPTAATDVLRRAESLPVHLSFGLVERRRLLAAGGFDEDFQRSQDFDLAVRLVQDGSSLVWPQGRALAGYVMHEGGVTANSYAEQFLAAELVRARLRGDTDAGYQQWMEHPELSRKAKRAMRSGSHYRKAAVAVGRRERLTAVREGAMAMAMSPGSVVQKLRWRKSGTATLQPATVPPSVLAEFSAGAAHSRG